MYTPKHVREKIAKLTFPELKDLAIKANNLNAFAFIDLDVKKVSELMDIEDAFEFYLKLVKDKKTGRLHSNASTIMREFRTFLLAKICFPEEM